MLAELRIVNFALIEQVHLRFRSGFTVFTGETGAGKSLLIDAIALLVGGRASTEQIRSGAEEAHIEASFQLSDDHPIIRRLRGEGTIGSTDTELILKRILSRSGRHRIYLNGSLCPLRILEELGGTLVDIHGQHEQQSLLSAGRQLDAVDAFGGLQSLRSQYEEAYAAWKELSRQLDALTHQGPERSRLEDLLRFQLQEIQRAGIQPGEDASLQRERERLVHAHRLRECAEEVHSALQADEQGVLVKLGRIGRLTGEIAQKDSAMQECKQQAVEATVLLKDLAGRLREYADHLEADTERQSTLEARLDVIQRLKKKYGGSIEAVLATQEQVKAELAQVENHETRIAEVTSLLEGAARRVADIGVHLSKKRREAAKRLTSRVGTELAALKMAQTGFHISMERNEAPESFGATGCDRVEFRLNNNQGEPPKALGRIASGGELSRVMLALKTVLAEQDHVPVLIFDEIDTGVGGAVAAAMGIRLRKLGKFHQVFCITHLPQVASQAEHHMLVKKDQGNGRTATAVNILNGINREAEIARMLGGVTVTKKIRETAAELIAGAKGKR